MTDRINSFIVVLEKDFREDDVAPLMQAVLRLRGVLAVNSNIVNVDSYVANERALDKLRGQLRDILWPKLL